MGYATLSRSRTYIMVPRDVPPENFLSVEETRKVERVGVGRCLLAPCLLMAGLLLLAGLLTGLGLLLSVTSARAGGSAQLVQWGGAQDDAPGCGEDWWGVEQGQCSPCLCSPLGSASSSCTRASGQCRCREGHRGHKCDICPQVRQVVEVVVVVVVGGIRVTSVILCRQV